MKTQFLAAPDRERSLRNYAGLARRYDASCARIRSLRERAVEALELRPGETVFDIACGTGAAFPLLAQAVGARGRMLGVEQSPHMATQALARAAALPCHCEVLVSPVEDLASELRADAMLFSYTHDVLQSPGAVAALQRHAAPGCRVAVLGIRTLPWAWGFPLNVFVLLRARRYLTTLRGIHMPWAHLRTVCSDLAPVAYYQLGTSYLAVGRFDRLRP